MAFCVLVSSSLGKREKDKTFSKGQQQTFPKVYMQVPTTTAIPTSKRNAIIRIRGTEVKYTLSGMKTLCSPSRFAVFIPGIDWKKDRCIGAARLTSLRIALVVWN